MKKQTKTEYLERLRLKDNIIKNIDFDLNRYQIVSKTYTKGFKKVNFIIFDTKTGDLTQAEADLE